MSLSDTALELVEPSGHVRPFGRDSTLVWYKVKVVVAVIVSALAVAWFVWLGYRQFLTDGTLTFVNAANTVIFCFMGVFMLGGTIMNGGTLSGHGPTFLPPEVFRLARTPVGWALLREGAELSQRRAQIRFVYAELDLIEEALATAPGMSSDVRVEFLLQALWAQQLRQERDLASRQRRHLDGETVAFRQELASSP